VTAYTARQLRSLGDERVNERLQALWGEVRETPAEKSKLITNYKKQLTPESLARADRSAGRAIYQKVCANCHRLFDSGGNIGPDLTGAQRTNLDYLLENLIDPSASVAKDFQVQVIVTESGRSISGLVVAETKTAVTIQTVNETVVVPTAEVESRTRSSASMMPDGTLQQLSAAQVRDLIAYVAGASQVPLSAQPTVGDSHSTIKSRP
jgi:putative heme-binding domain-containing protein